MDTSVFVGLLCSPRYWKGEGEASQIIQIGPDRERLGLGLGPERGGGGGGDKGSQQQAGLRKDER